MYAMKSAIKAILIDLSGTLHVEDVAIPGAIEALNKLRSSGANLRFVTNTTKESGHRLWTRLSKLGFSLEHNEIFSSLTAAHRLVHTRNLRPMLFLEDEALEEFEGIDTSNPNTVVIGLAPNHFNYEKLNKAFNLIQDQQAPLIAIHKGRYYRRKDGLALGPGPFVTALEFACDTQAEVVGKPQTQFFLQGLASLSSSSSSLSPSQTIMIGDDVRDDIEGAQKAGMIGILVKTGKYKEGDEHKISPPPQFVAKDFPGAVDIILKISKEE